MIAFQVFAKLLLQQLQGQTICKLETAKIPLKGMVTIRGRTVCLQSPFNMNIIFIGKEKSKKIFLSLFSDRS